MVESEDTPILTYIKGNSTSEDLVNLSLFQVNVENIDCKLNFVCAAIMISLYSTQNCDKDGILAILDSYILGE